MNHIYIFCMWIVSQIWWKKFSFLYKWTVKRDRNLFCFLIYRLAFQSTAGLEGISGYCRQMWFSLCSQGAYLITMFSCVTWPCTRSLFCLSIRGQVFWKAVGLLYIVDNSLITSQVLRKYFWTKWYMVPLNGYFL